MYLVFQKVQTEETEETGTETGAETESKDAIVVSPKPAEQTESAEAAEPKKSPEPPTIDVPFTITNAVPDSSRPVDDQLSLF